MADLRFCAYQYQHLPLDARGAAPGEEAVFEEVTATVMPRLRADAMTM